MRPWAVLTQQQKIFRFRKSTKRKSHDVDDIDDDDDLDDDGDDDAEDSDHDVTVPTGAKVCRTEHYPTGPWKQLFSFRV